MKQLPEGTFFGAHHHTWKAENLILTDTDYLYDHVDWHYHEHPYFTYLLRGKLFEGNKQQEHHLEAGGLLFHNWQDAHYNIKAPEYTRGFHIELTADWLAKFDLSTQTFEGSRQIDHPLIQEAMSKIYLEFKKGDEHSMASIELLLLGIFGEMKQEALRRQTRPPQWVNRLRQLLEEEPELARSLKDLTAYLNIHPVHLSRTFSSYFGTTLGDYLRRRKVNRAALLISNTAHSLTQIAYDCGFYDQSHLIHQFKKVYGLTPRAYRKQLRPS